MEENLYALGSIIGANSMQGPPFSQGLSNRRRVVLPLLSTLIATSPHGFAQTGADVFGTEQINFLEERVAGQLQGCVLGFDQVLQDFANKRGGVVHLSGSIGFEAAAGHVGMSIKLVPSDVIQASTGQLKLTSFTPAYAYATFGAVSTAGREVKRFACDDPGFCAIYAPDLITAFSDSLDPKGSAGFRISYQRFRNGLDVATMVQLPRAPTQPGWQVMVNFSRCAVALLGGLTN